MKKLTVFIVVVFVIVLSVQSSFSIGHWAEGSVTKAPWSDRYVFIEIDNVKFTIMKNAKILDVYQKKGATYKVKMRPSSISEGHILSYKKEGNRIYQIEKIK